MRGAEGLVQVGEEIIRVLEPDRETQQINRAGRALDRAAMLDQALDAAQRGGALPQLDLGGGRDGGCLAALGADRQHGAKAAHLAGRDGVSRMARKAGIKHACKAWMM